MLAYNDHNWLQMLCEMTMVDTDTYLQFLPSKIAASCVCLASHTLGAVAWVSLTELSITQISFLSLSEEEVNLMW